MRQGTACVEQRNRYINPWTLPGLCDLPGMHWDVFRVFAYGLQQAQGPKLFFVYGNCSREYDLCDNPPYEDFVFV